MNEKTRVEQTEFLVTRLLSECESKDGVAAIAALTLTACLTLIKTLQTYDVDFQYDEARKNRCENTLTLLIKQHMKEIFKIKQKLK